jgi:hypothetical protein
MTPTLAAIEVARRAGLGFFTAEGTEWIDLGFGDSGVIRERERRRVVNGVGVWVLWGSTMAWIEDARRGRELKAHGEAGAANDCGVDWAGWRQQGRRRRRELAGTGAALRAGGVGWSCNVPEEARA